MKKVATILTVLVLGTLAFAGVTVSSPTNNSTVPLSTSVKAYASPSSSSNHITSMAVYVNGSKKYSTSNDSLSTSVSVSNGYNKMQVKAWDNAGNSYTKTVYVYAGYYSKNSDGVVTVSKIEQMSGWGQCDACAGKDGDGSSASLYMKHGIDSPSMDGNSSKFFIGGDTPYANALWWKQIINNSTEAARPHHFIVDFYMYYTNSSAPQALEFTVTQYISGKQFNFGMQCNIRTGDGPQWDVSLDSGWSHTGLSCPAPPTYKWNHIVMEVERTSTNRMHYISISLNGNKHYVNRYSNYESTPYSGAITYHWQMDGNSKMTDYATYLDKVTVKYW